MIGRMTVWYKFKTEDYVFYMIALNLVAVVIYLNEILDIVTDYPFFLELIVALGLVFLVMEMNKKSIVRRIKSIINNLKG